MNDKRLRAVLAGESVKPLAYSFWRHFVPEENTLKGLVDVMLSFQKEYGHDFIKLNPRSTYFIEDWLTDFQPGEKGRKRKPDVARVKAAGELAELPRLDPKSGVLGEHLRALAQVVENSPVPVIQTLFNPLSYAGRLVSSPQEILAYASDSAAELKKGLEHLAGMIAEYADACLEAGAVGVFFATTEWGSRDLISDELYGQYGTPYDKIATASLDQRAWFSVMHVCGDENRLESFFDCPMQALNWDANGKGNPSLADARARTHKVLVGGLSQGLVEKEENMPRIEEEIDQAVESCRGEKFILGAGCCLPETADAKVLAGIKEYLASK